MKYHDQLLARSALAVQFISNCLSIECVRPEMTGALRIAYGSNSVVIRDIDS